MSYVYNELKKRIFDYQCDNRKANTELDEATEIWIRELCYLLSYELGKIVRGEIDLTMEQINDKKYRRVTIGRC